MASLPKQDIPDVPFVKKTKPELEFEIVVLSNLFKRQSSIDHLLTKPHRIQFYSILCITQGEGHHYVDFKAYAYQPGSIFLIAKEQVHAYDVNANNDGFLFLFTERFLTHYLYQSDILSVAALFNDPLNDPVLRPEESRTESLLTIAEAIRHEYDWLDDFAKQEILSNLLKIFLLKVERVKRQHVLSLRHPERYRQFLSFRDLVMNQYRETRNAMDYAKKLSMSYKHLNEICKEFTMRTAKEFIDNWVVLEVRRSLASSDLSIKEIAYKAGFDEPTNLIKYFRKLTNQTPTQFRSTLTVK